MIPQRPDHPSAANRIDFDVQQLENRLLLAGTVNVQLRGSMLHINGDGNDNDIEVTTVGNSFVVSSGSNTTAINNIGNRPLQNVRNVRINLKAGNDKLLVDQVKVDGLLRIDDDSGNNDLDVQWSELNAISIDNSGGMQFNTLAYNQIEKFVKVVNGDGGSQTVIRSTSGRSIHGNITVTNGIGANGFLLDNVRVRDGNIKITNGGGSTETVIRDSDRIRSIKVLNKATSGVPAEVPHHYFTLENTLVESGSVDVTNQKGGSSFRIANSFVDGSLWLSSESNRAKGGIDELVSHNFDVINSDIGRSLGLYAYGDANLANDVSFTVDNSRIQSKTFIDVAGNASSNVRLQDRSEFAAIDIHAGGGVTTDTRLDDITADRMVRIESSVSALSSQKTVVQDTEITGVLNIDHNDGRSHDADVDSEIEVYRSTVSQLLVTHGSGGSHTEIVQSTVTNKGIRMRSNQGVDSILMDDVNVNGVVDIRTNNATRRERESVGGLDQDYVGIDTIESYSGASRFTGQVRIRTGRGDDHIKIGSYDNTGGRAIFTSSVTLDGELGLDDFAEIGLFNQFASEPRIIDMTRG